MSADVISDFLDAMREHGLEPADQIVADGTLHRVRWRQDKAGTRNGAYAAASQRPSGRLRSSASSAASNSPGPPRARASTRPSAGVSRPRWRRSESAGSRRSASGTSSPPSRHRRSSPRARDADPDHAYLKRKGVEPHGLKVDADNRLVIPLRDPKGTVWSVQTIAPDGTKLFLKGGRKSGLFHLLGEPGDDLVIAEGFATAASIREATGLPVVIAFDAGNLKPVAKSIRAWLPLARIVIAADDDHATDGNPGLTKAQAAAELIGGNVAVPVFLDGEERGTDFNDLAALRGHEPVAAIIRAAFEDEADEPEPAPDPDATARSSARGAARRRRLGDAAVDGGRGAERQALRHHNRRPDGRRHADPGRCPQARASGLLEGARHQASIPAPALPGRLHAERPGDLERPWRSMARTSEPAQL